VPKQLTVAIYFLAGKKKTMEVNCKLLGFQHSSKYLILCSAEERHLCRFGTT